MQCSPARCCNGHQWAVVTNRMVLQCWHSGLSKIEAGMQCCTPPPRSGLKRLPCSVQPWLASRLQACFKPILRVLLVLNEQSCHHTAPLGTTPFCLCCQTWYVPHAPHPTPTHPAFLTPCAAMSPAARCVDRQAGQSRHLCH